MTRPNLIDPNSERGLGALVAEAASEMSTLVRQEIALAKAELGQSVKSAGIGAGAFAAAGATGLLALLFLSLAAIFGLDAAGLSITVSALIVAGFWLLITAGLGLVGKSKMSHIGGVPRTAKTLKEDVEWARHPTS
ncbi:MAG TPA: phage holin family protein [Mycobacteriales bacterium]|nr:phage holin family protein [Mycobacteriales bacterium]